MNSKRVRTHCVLLELDKISKREKCWPPLPSNVPLLCLAAVAPAAAATVRHTVGLLLTAQQNRNFAVLFDSDMFNES